MKIEIRFTNEEARRVQYFLKKKYKSRASLETLVKRAIRETVANQAQKEVLEIEKDIE